MLDYVEMGWNINYLIVQSLLNTQQYLIKIESYIFRMIKSAGN